MIRTSFQDTLQVLGLSQATLGSPRSLVFPLEGKIDLIGGHKLSAIPTHYEAWIKQDIFSFLTKE